MIWKGKSKSREFLKAAMFNVLAMREKIEK
jgi:hypothetical protein